MTRKPSTQPDTRPPTGKDSGGIKRLNITELIPDNRNANIGTDEGAVLLKKSIRKHGAARGVLVDKNLKIIAGNHTVQELARQGYTDVIVVPSDGRTLVVTQRTDITKDSKAGHEIAIADNRVSQANICLDTDVISDLKAEFSLDLDGFSFSDNEVAGEIFDSSDDSEQMEYPHQESNAIYSTPGREPQKQFEQSYFPLAIALSKAERLKFDEWKKGVKVRTDTEGFQLLFKIATNT